MSGDTAVSAPPMMPPWLLPSNVSSAPVSIRDAPSPFWNALWPGKPRVMARPRKMKFSNPCWVRSATVWKRVRSASADTTFGTSSSAIPIHFVAQKTKPCSAAIALTLPAPTSLSRPSRPCP